MIDAGEVYESTKAAFIDALAMQPKAARMMRLDPFEAEDEDGNAVKVIGLYDDDKDMRFIIIDEQEDGELVPFACSQIYRKGTNKS